MDMLYAYFFGVDTSVGAANKAAAVIQSVGQEIASSNKEERGDLRKGPAMVLGGYTPRQGRSETSSERCIPVLGLGPEGVQGHHVPWRAHRGAAEV